MNRSDKQDPEEGNTSHYVEPAHEALVRAWDTALEWRRGEAEKLPLQRAVTQAARAWDGGRGTGGLWTGDKRLDRVRELLREDPYWLNAAEAQFIQESARRRTRNGRTLWSSVIAVLVALSILAGVAFVQRNSARTNAAQALSRQLAAQANIQVSGEPDLALLLAVQANRVFPTDEARGSLLDVLARTAKIRTYLHGNVDAVRALTVSANSGTIASCAADGRVLLWDVKSRERRDSPTDKDSWFVTTLGFFSRGDILAFGDKAGTIRFWNAANEYLVGAPVVLGAQPIVSLAVGKGDAWFAAGTEKGVKICRSYKGKWQITSLLASSESGEEHLVAFSHQEEVLAVISRAHGSGRLTLWDTRSFPFRKLATQSDIFVPWRPVFSSDGSRVAVSTYEGIQFFETRSGRPVPLRLPDKDPCFDVAMSPDGRHLAAIQLSNRPAIFPISGVDRRGQTEYAVPPIKSPDIDGHADYAVCTLWSPDGAWLATGGRDGTVILWDVEGGRGLVERLPTASFIPAHMGISGLSGQLVLSDRSGATQIWDLKTRTLRRSHPALGRGTDPINFMGVSEDGNRQLLIGSDDFTYERDLRSGAAVRTFKVRESGSANIYAASRDLQYVAFFTTNTGSLKMWRSGTRSGLKELGTAGNGGTDGFGVNNLDVRTIAFSPDNSIIAAPGGNGEGMSVFLKSTQTGSLTRELKGHVATIYAIAFTPDGSILASGSYDQTVQIWNVQSGNPLRLIPIRHSVQSVAFMNVAGKVVVAALDGAGGISLWDVNTGLAFGGRILLPADLPINDVTSGALAFSPDAKTLVIRLDDSIFLLNVSFESLESRALENANRNFRVNEWARFMPADQSYYSLIPTLPVPSERKLQPREETDETF